MPDFGYRDLLPIGADTVTYRRLSTHGVRTIEGPGGRIFLEVDPEALALLADTAMHDIAHYLRPAHLAQLRSIIDDPEASNNDKFVIFSIDDIKIIAFFIVIVNNVKEKIVRRFRND